MDIKIKEEVKADTSIYKCDQCMFTTESERNLRMHKKSTHALELKQISKGPSISTFLCNICQYKFKSKGGLARHKTVIHVKKADQTNERNKGPKRLVDTFTCTHCNSTFTAINTLNKHIESQHAKGDLDTSLISPPRKKVMQNVQDKCCICGKIFQRRTLLIAHMKSDHNAAKDNNEKDAFIKQLNEKVRGLEDEVKKLQHQLDNNKREVKRTPRTSDPQPLEAMVNIIEVLETKEISQEESNVKTNKETNDTSKYDEFKRPKEIIVRGGWKVTCDKCELVLESNKMLNEHIKEEHYHQDNKFERKESQGQETVRAVTEGGTKAKGQSGSPGHCLPAHGLHTAQQEPPLAIGNRGLELEPKSAGRLEAERKESQGKEMGRAGGEPMDWEEVKNNKTHNIVTKAKKVDDTNNTLANKLRFSEILMCDICGNVFKDTKLFKDHKILEHEDSDTEDGDYTCDDCPFQTNSESCMDNHIKQTKHMSRHNKETVEDYICKKCGTECETGKELRVHMGGHTGDQQCDFCNMEFMTRHLLRRHMRYNHNINMEDSYKIQTNDSYDMEYNSDDPMYTQEPVGNSPFYPCRFCKKIFKDQNEVANHRRHAHKTYKPCKNIAICKFGQNCYFSHDPILNGNFRCFQCGDEFTSTSDMMIHRKNLHENIKICKKFIDNECDRGDNC